MNQTSADWLHNITYNPQHVWVVEPLVLLAMAFLSYFLAECLHWSGIIGLLGCGIMQGR